MRKQKAFVSVALVALAATILGFAGCNRHRGTDERIAHKIDHIGYHLDLTDQQQVKLEEVKVEILQARGEIHDDHLALFDEMIAQIESSHLNQTTVLELLDRHHTLVKQAAPRVVAKAVEFHATLTQDQKAKAVEHLEWIKKKRMH